MGRAAGIPELAHLIVEGPPLPSEDVGPGDDDVDLGRPLADGGLDLRQLQAVRDLAGGETGRDRGHGNRRAGKRLDRHRDQVVVDTDRRHRDPEVGSAEPLEDVGPNRLPRLRAEAAHVSRRVVAGERRQVDGRDGPQQPGGPPGLLDRAPGREGHRPPFDRGPVDPGLPNPAEVERDPRVAPDRLRGADGGGHGSARHDRPPGACLRPTSGQAGLWTSSV